jgi:phosphotransferase system HPr (HPr) family protein
MVVEHEVGLHARPAAMFVKAAKQYESDIKIIHGEKEGNAKSILSVLTLGVNQGAEITIQAEGCDADEALHTLQGLIEDNFGETE